MNVFHFLLLSLAFHRSKAQTYQSFNASGTGSSPNYPANYPPNSTVRWIITTPDTSKLLQLQINALNVEGYASLPNCAEDYLLLIPQSAGLGPVCNRSNMQIPGAQAFCNNHGPTSFPANIVVNTYTMTVEFCSDSLLQYSGVQFSWLTIDSTPATGGPVPSPTTTYNPHFCGHRVFLAVGQSANISSPNFMGPYPNNAGCSWGVQSQSGEIRVNSNFFDVEGPYPVCNFDDLMIFEPNLNLTLRYCGNTGPQNLSIPSSGILIKFSSDSAVSRFGFQITVSAPPLPPTPVPSLPCYQTFRFNSPSQFVILNSPGYPVQYPNYAQCRWDIWNDVYQNYTLKVTFNSFHTEFDYDFLNIFPRVGPSSDFSGVVRNGTVAYFEGSYIDFFFYADYIVEYQGFQLNLTLSEKPFACALGQFKCVTGQTCIPIGQLCDGTAQCPDKSDETETWCKMQNVCGTMQVKPNIYIPPFLPNGVRERFPAFIVNGSVAKPGSWPWTVEIMQASRTGYTHRCGAALIAPHWVLTTAHCIYTPIDAAVYRVKVGSYRSNVSDVPYEFDTNATALFPHPNYNSASISYNFALVRLAQDVPFPFNAHINSVCLPQQGQPVRVGTNCVATGWGQTESSSGSQVLREVILPVLDSAGSCNSSYYNKLDNSMLCAGYMQGGPSTCFGDGGGPLVCQSSPGHWVVQGLTSFLSNLGCGYPNKPTVYSRVSVAVDWIYQTMAEND